MGKWPKLRTNGGFGRCRPTTQGQLERETLEWRCKCFRRALPSVNSAGRTPIVTARGICRFEFSNWEIASGRQGRRKHVDQPHRTRFVLDNDEYRKPAGKRYSISKGTYIISDWCSTLNTPAFPGLKLASSWRNSSALEMALPLAELMMSPNTP
jgi:hypothetical protein